MLTSPIAIFRYEASSHLGVGHAMRCNALAEVLSKKGWECYLATSDKSYSFILEHQKFKRLDPDIFWTNPFNHNLLVLDHYEINIDYEKHFRPYAEKILVIDDLADRQHDCDILLDCTLGRVESDYKKLTPVHCELLIGSEYALLKTEFAKIRPKAFIKRQQTKDIKKILISMGGSDLKNNSLEAIKMIERSKFSGFIDVILGFSSPHFETIKKFSASMKNNIIIHNNINYMADMIYEVDLAMGAAGSSVWERCCLGLPSILIKTAENQNYIYENIQKRFNQNYNILNYKLIDEFLNNFTMWENISQSAFQLCDGFGVNRVVNKILYGDEKVKLVKANRDHLDITYHWQQQKEVRHYFLNPHVPTKSEHSEWFLSKINHLLDVYYIILYDNIPCGAVCLTFMHDINMYSLSWYLSKDFQGKGIGTHALKLAVNLVFPHKVKAFVFSENKASIRSLIKAGFSYTGNNIYLSEL